MAQHDAGPFKADPVLVLQGIEGVRAALAEPDPWFKLVGDRYRVKSDWLIDLIDEIAATRYPYNAVIRALARERLGLPALSEAENAREGTPLSALVYNAQNYRHSDQLRAQGYEPLTQELAERAYAEGKVVIGQNETVLSPREVSGKVYLFKPRKRVNAVFIGNCEPVRLADAPKRATQKS